MKMNIITRALLIFFICMFNVSSAFAEENAIKQQISNEEQIIGIFGDIHGNIDGARVALEQMAQRKITHLIGTGDFIEYGGAEELEAVLSIISEITGVQRDNIYLMPGNWEHTQIFPEDGYNNLEVQAAVEANDDARAHEIFKKKSIGRANKILKKYGHLIADDCYSYGVIEIAGKRIMVSHYPQHSIPKKLLPPEEYLMRNGGRAMILDTMDKNIYSPENVDFEIIAHTHVAGSYMDPKAKKCVINPGVIDPRRKRSSELQAFAVYYVNEGRLDHVCMGENEIKICQTLSFDDGCNMMKGSKWDQALRFLRLI